LNSLNAVSQKADSYNLLSQCYYLPEDQLIQKVTDAAISNPFFEEIACHLLPAVEIEQLRVEFTRLFVGPFKVLASPYGSAYLDDNRIMGDSTLDVQNRYKNEGLKVILKDAPDHIAMELEFMYYLSGNEAEASNINNLEIVQSYKQKQLSFLQDHLASWLPSFVEKVQKHAQTDFYKNLAHLTNTFVQNDMAELQKGMSAQSHTTIPMN